LQQYYPSRTHVEVHGDELLVSSTKQYHVSAGSENNGTVEGFVKLPGIFRPSLTQLTNLLDHKKLLRDPVITL
jgi:hypothetical protein